MIRWCMTPGMQPMSMAGLGRPITIPVAGLGLASVDITSFNQSKLRKGKDAAQNFIWAAHP